jgi:predicted DNA-binding transcriptional regulator YafY
LPRFSGLEQKRLIGNGLRMNRRGFLRAAVAAGLAHLSCNPVDALQSGESDAQHRNETTIRHALREHCVIEFRYHGHPRRVEPHALGRMKDGDLALLGWQAAGGSGSEPPPGWRNFLLVEIEVLAPTADKFTPRSDYRPEKTHFAEIIAEVAP